MALQVKKAAFPDSADVPTPATQWPSRLLTTIQNITGRIDLALNASDELHNLALEMYYLLPFPNRLVNEGDLLH